jgi:hypothetical protein
MLQELSAFAELTDTSQLADQSILSTLQVALRLPPQRP